MVAMVKEGWWRGMGVLVVGTTAQGGLVTHAGSEGVDGGCINLAPEGKRQRRGFSTVESAVGDLDSFAIKV